MINTVIDSCYAGDLQRATSTRFDDKFELSDEKAAELIRRYAVDSLAPRFGRGGDVYIDMKRVIPLIMEHIDENSTVLYEGSVPQSVIDAVEYNNGTLCPIEWLSVAHDIATAGTVREYGESDINGLVPVTVVQIEI